MATATISFSNWVKANKIVFGVLINSKELTRRERDCLELTRRNLLLHNDAARTNYMEGDSIDAMVSSASMWGYKFLWIQSAGHYILDKPGIQIAIDEELQRGFFILGHILDYGEKYYSIHHQCMLIDIGIWDAIGRPKFGRAGVEDRLLHMPRRSPDNFHDTHTPKWIEPSGKTMTYSEQAIGWNFLACGLDRGVRIAPFSSAIRARKGYLYPEEDFGYYFKLGDYRRRAREWSEAAWVVNTEEWTVPTADFEGPVETVVGVASGLKLYLILFKLGFTDQTAVHYVDSSVATLNFKKWLLEYWDGRDYSTAVSRWLSHQPSSTHLQKDFSETKLIDGAATLYAHFGGEDQFVQQWEAFRKLPHTFNHVDLFTTDHRKVLKMLPNGTQHTVLWFSNIFHSYYTHSLLSHEEGEKLYCGWINMLQDKAPNAFVLCKDHYHSAIAGRARNLDADRTPPILRSRFFPPEIVEWFDKDFERSRKEFADE
jgi:hypothetical protein